MKQGYKQTEVGVIPEDWEVRQIRDVCNLINGRGFKPFEWKTEGLPIIRIQNLNGSDDFNYYQGFYDKKLEIDDGQLLFAWSGSRGTSFGPHIWFGTKGLLNYHTWKVVVDENVIVKPFFTHALKNLTKFIEDRAHGASALVHTQKWEMESFEFPTPNNYTEQTAIATALSDADALINSLEKLIAKKRNIKQGAMQKLLQPKEGWEVKKLGEIGELITGSTPPTQIKKYWNGTIPWITPTDISNNEKDIYYSEREISIEGLKVIRKLPLNTLLVTCIASIGKNAILRRNGACNQQINAIIPYCVFDVDFLYYLIENNNQYLLGNAGITATLMISKKDFSDIIFSFPPKEEQTRIATILSDMDADITALENKLEKYRNIKLGMMQNLLTGKIRLIIK